MINNSNLTLQYFNTHFNTHYNQKSGRVYNFYKLITHYLGSQNRFFPPGFFLRRIWILKISWLNAEELITYNGIVFEFITHPQKKNGIFMKKSVKNGVFSGIHPFRPTPPYNPPGSNPQLFDER